MAPILIFDGINNGFADIIQCNPGNMKMPLRRVGMIPQIAAEGMAFPEKWKARTDSNVMIPKTCLAHKTLRHYGCIRCRTLFEDIPFTANVPHCILKTCKRRHLHMEDIILHSETRIILCPQNKDIGTPFFAVRHGSHGAQTTLNR